MTVQGYYRHMDGRIRPYRNTDARTIVQAVAETIDRIRQGCADRWEEYRPECVLWARPRTLGPS